MTQNKNNLLLHEIFTNLVTKILVPPAIVTKILNVFKESCNIYEKFYKEQFIQQYKIIFDTINKVKFPSLKTEPENNSEAKKINFKKEI